MRPDKSCSAWTLVYLTGPRAMLFNSRAIPTMTLNHASSRAIRQMLPASRGSSPPIASGADHPPDNQTPNPVGRGDLIVPPHGPPLRLTLSSKNLPGCERPRGRWLRFIRIPA